MHDEYSKKSVFENTNEYMHITYKRSKLEIKMSTFEIRN